MDLRLYAITDRSFFKTIDIIKAITIAIENGATIIQLREKELSSREFYEMALNVKKITKKHNIPLIINDRIDIALAADAEGVHVGPDDLPVNIVRKIIGKHKIIGASAYSVEEALRVQKEGADYIGAGSVFNQSIKSDVKIIGINGLKEIKDNVKIPVVAIGGIRKENVYEVMLKSGIDGVSTITGIFDGNIQLNTQQISKEIDRALKDRRDDK
ncbi:MAG: thiamine phosphate synthase [Thermoanaerobacteraceae bacterium]